MKEHNDLDFKYRELITSLSEPVNTPNVKANYIKPCLDTFLLNMSRTTQLARVPAIMAFAARKDQLFISNANFRAGGKNETPIQEWLEQPFTPEIDADFKRQSQDFNNLPEEQRESLLKVHGYDYFARHLQINADVASSIEHIFSSIIMGAWTAFECLAGDLWAAVNRQRSDAFCSFSLQQGIGQRRNNSTRRFMADSGIDPRKNLGTFLIEFRRVSFQRLPIIRRRYNDAFGKDCEELFDSVAGGYIKALSATRNLLAHKTGRVDKPFQAATNSFEEFKLCNEDDDLRLDGAIVSKLRNSALLVGLELTKFVDNSVTVPSEAMPASTV